MSCSSYSVPIALLAIAQAEIEKASKEGRKITPNIKKSASGAATSATKKTAAKKAAGNKSAK